ncbi:DUF881 domain-containing protein [Nocardioides sp.]|uniref:DUF881 domain-containing protein n=1 Tax=Nocardioides sp. TaxID=35761 RepID=UPI003D14A5C6
MAHDPALDARARRRRQVWRVGTPLVAILSGALFVVSAESSDGTDLRPGRYPDLSSIVSAESGAVENLKARAANLNQEVQQLTAGVGDKKVNRINAEVADLKGPAGRLPVSGPGLTVTLTDSPESVQVTDEVGVKLLVVHQQDIQAVVNAMWLGGASAVTIQGQRVISTTGIKCSGNAVRLHGIPYAQPYVISAVGDQDSLYTSIMGDAYLEVYRGQAEDPDIEIGWDLELEDFLEAPGYDSPVDMAYAQVLR